MDKNSRVARLLEIEREKQKALFALGGRYNFLTMMSKKT